MINKTILHFKILEKLGEGGMRAIYKAAYKVESLMERYKLNIK